MVKFAICRYTEDGTFYTDRAEWRTATDIASAFRQVETTLHDYAGLFYPADVAQFVANPESVIGIDRHLYESDPYKYGIPYIYLPQHEKNQSGW